MSTSSKYKKVVAINKKRGYSLRMRSGKFDPGDHQSNHIIINNPRANALKRILFVAAVR